MKSRKSRVVALILLAVIIGGAIGWFAFLRTFTGFVDIKIVPVAKADAPKTVAQAAPVAQVELPKTPAVAAKQETVSSQTEAATIAQAELKATAQDMARLVREKGRIAMLVANARPDFIANLPLDGVQQMLDLDTKMAEDPKERQKREKLVEELDLLATLTPTLNATGDKAIYYDEANPDGIPKELANFVKINGKWSWQDYMGNNPSDPFTPTPMTK